MTLTKQLHQFGYAPGDYFFKCGRCQRQEMGDKRAITCRECALELLVMDQQTTIKTLQEFREAAHPLHKFLLGIAPYNGVWFDEASMASWRTDLYKMLNDSNIEISFKRKENTDVK